MLFATCIAVEQEVTSNVTVIMIAFSIFTHFWCTPARIQSKPSSKNTDSEVGLQNLRA